jgi:ABC-2 type transport system permease protein
LAVIVVISVTSCTAFGLTLGSIGMRARDVFMSANIAYYLMWLLCGVNIPLSALPGWLAQIGRLLPLTHGIAAGREVAAGASLSSVSGLVWTEVAVGTAWAVVATTLVWWFEREGRRRATLETF